MKNFLRSLFGGGGDTRLNDDLVARIIENLKLEPSEQLHEILTTSAAEVWSPEAREAVRLLLEQRANQTAPDPVYRTVPRTPPVQAARMLETVAPGISPDLLMLDVGSRVFCLWREQGGTIIRWDDEEDRFYVRLDNGEGEWATLGLFS